MDWRVNLATCNIDVMIRSFFSGDSLLIFPIVNPNDPCSLKASCDLIKFVPSCVIVPVEPMRYRQDRKCYIQD